MKKYIICFILSFCFLCPVQAAKPKFEPLTAEIAKKNLNYSCLMDFITALKSGDDKKAASFCDESFLENIKTNHGSLKAYGEKYFQNMDMKTLVYRAYLYHKKDRPTMQFDVKFSGTDGKQVDLTFYVWTEGNKKEIVAG